VAYKDIEKQQQYQRDWYQRNKERRLKRQRELRDIQRQIIAQEKVRRGCAHCGYRESPVALDAHHHNGDKEFEIGKAVVARKSIEEIMIELAKCEILCANCHRIEHYEKKQLGE
jgi:hypothetical protein